MIEFYGWPKGLLIFLSILFAISIVVQALAVFFSFYRHPLTKQRVFEGLLELFVLVQILTCSLLLGQVSMGNEMAMIMDTDYGNLRIGLCFVAVVLSLIVGIMNRIFYPLLIIIACGLTLPFSEFVMGDWFPFLFCLTLLFWLVRGIHINLLRITEIRNSISTWSIKNAIDKLPSGLMFYETNGGIVLVNIQMQRLMEQLIGRVARDGKRFVATLANEQCRPDCRKANLAGQIVYLLPDESVWMFYQNDLQYRRKHYYQLAAVNVTQRWQLTQELHQKNNQLLQHSKKLKETIDNIYNFCREQEIQKTKMRAHDILGARLAIFLRMLRSETPIKRESLEDLTADILMDMKKARVDPIPQEQLDQLRDAFKKIGVEVFYSEAIPGEGLPPDQAGEIFVDIVLEGVTNAVRHGFANEVYVQFEKDATHYRMQITDNGQPVSHEFQEGGGIGGMRKKLADYDGKLEITNIPHFKVVATLPKAMLPKHKMGLD
ncbi:MAG TPA: hypothetical protein GX717_03065 [Clostridiaceae bacterium]|nr:hypothetical protein [Clostridiaceae bacterium]